MFTSNNLHELDTKPVVHKSMKKDVHAEDNNLY